MSRAKSQHGVRVGALVALASDGNPGTSYEDARAAVVAFAAKVADATKRMLWALDNATTEPTARRVAAAAYYEIQDYAVGEEVAPLRDAHGLVEAIADGLAIESTGGIAVPCPGLPDGVCEAPVAAGHRLCATCEDIAAEATP